MATTTQIPRATAPDIQADDGILWLDDGAGGGIRQLANLVGTLLTSAARTTTVAGASMTNVNHRGLVIYVVVTAATGTTPTLAVRLNAIDPVTGNAFVVTTFASITAAGTYAYAIYPTALAGSWTGTLNSILSRTFSVDFVIGGTTPSFTFSAGYSLLI